MSELWIRFQGKDWILTEGGAITTPDDYAAGLCSYAHLCGDDLVRRFHEVIGAREDIKVLGPCEHPGPQGLDALEEMLFGDSWTAPTEPREES